MVSYPVVLLTHTACNLFSGTELRAGYGMERLASMKSVGMEGDIWLRENADAAAV
jgi:hypothetical protein